jgi:predicted transcriptional regulator
MNLDTFLKERGLSEHAFAAQIGTSQAAVSKYRLGYRFPKPAIMARIEEATSGLCSYKDFTSTPAAGDARPKKVRIGLRKTK